MRAAVIALLLAGCSLDFIGEGNDEPVMEPDPVLRCELGPRYRMPHVDCGPLPPDAPPPTSCFWTITVRPDTLDYCYTDVCETLRYTCTGREVTATNPPGTVFTGELLGDGTLLWDGGGWQSGEYQPY